MARLENRERFPRFTAATTSDGTMTLPDDLAGSWAVLVFYRGHF